MSSFTAQDIARRLGVPMENMVVVTADEVDDEPKKPLAADYLRACFFEKVKTNNRGGDDHFPGATLIRQSGFASMRVAYATFKDTRSLCRVLSCGHPQMVPLQGPLGGFVAWVDEEGKLNGAERNHEAEALVGDMVFGKINGDMLLTRASFNPGNRDWARRFAVKTKLAGHVYGSGEHKAWMRAMCDKHGLDYEEDNDELHQELEETETAQASFGQSSSDEEDYKDAEDKEVDARADRPREIEEGGSSGDKRKLA